MQKKELILYSARLRKMKKICKEASDKCEYTISPVRRKDAQTIKNLIDEIFPYMKGYSALMVPHIYTQPEIAYVIKSNDKPVGILALQEREGEGWIDLIGLKREYRGNHLGSELIKFAEDVLKERGIKRANLHAEASKLDNLKFYSDLNWKIDEVNLRGYHHSASVKFSKNL